MSPEESEHRLDKLVRQATRCDFGWKKFDYLLADIRYTRWHKITLPGAHREEITATTEMIKTKMLDIRNCDYDKVLEALHWTDDALDSTREAIRQVDDVCIDVVTKYDDEYYRQRKMKANELCKERLQQLRAQAVVLEKAHTAIDEAIDEAFDNGVFDDARNWRLQN